MENEWGRRLVKLSFPSRVLKTWVPEAARVCRLSLGSLISKPQHSGETYIVATSLCDLNSRNLFGIAHFIQAFHIRNHSSWRAAAVSEFLSRKSSVPNQLLGTQ